MGQKVNPVGIRLGHIKGWDSHWFGGKQYADKIGEDLRIRNYLMARLKKASISRIVIERTVKLITVTIKTARPGVIIGKGGQEVDKLKEELKKLTNKDVQINIFEIKRPSWMPGSSVIVSPDNWRARSPSAVRSKWRSTPPCVWARRGSRSRSRVG